MLLDGSYVALNEGDAHVMSYLRSYKGKAVLVALNMSTTSRKATFDLSNHGFGGASLKALIASPGAAVGGNQVTLEPYGLMIAEVKQ